MPHTLTFSNDQLAAMRDALQARIEHFEAMLVEPMDRDMMVWFRKKLDVSRQALDAVLSQGNRKS